MTDDVAPAQTPAEPHAAAARGWDFALTAITVALLGGLGVQSFLGTVYTWWAQRSVLGWEQTGYPAYVSAMNGIAAPMIVALVVVMGLCVPKRLFSRRVLVGVSALMLLAGAAGGAVALSRGESTGAALGTGLAAYLVLAALIQVAVVGLTIAGVQGPSYMTEGRVTKAGSGLLHLGFIVFAFVVVALQRSAFMLPVFWLSAVLSVAGTVLSFYAKPIGRALRRRRPGSER